MMLSSLGSYLSARFFSETTEPQDSDELDTASHGFVQEVRNGQTSGSDDKLVGGLKEMVALAKESSAKLADGLKNTAKHISDKITSSIPFVEFDRAQSDFVSTKHKEGWGVDTELPSPSLLLASPGGKSCGEEDKKRQQRVKEQVLRLSLEEQNFLRPPPHGSCFQWNQKLARQYTPIARALLQEDPNLAALRFRLVPRRVKEDDFWRNYFYRVSLIRQSEGLPVEITPPTSKPAAIDDSDDEPATVVGNEAGIEPIAQGLDQPARMKAGDAGNGLVAPEAGDSKQNLSPSVSSPVALSLSSDQSADVIEAELMLEGSDLDNSVVIDDNFEREILAELNTLEE